MIDCGPYFIFPVIGAALIRERRLFESGAYFSYGEYRETYVRRVLGMHNLI